MGDHLVKTRKAFVDAPTGQVMYRTLGDGDPIVLLHQSPGSSLMYERAYPLFAEAGFCAIGIDTPGFGMSDVPAWRPSIEDYAGVVPIVLDALGVEQAPVVGHHTGAANACALATRFPSRVAKLVFSGPPIWTEKERATRVKHARRVALEPKPDGSHLMERWLFRCERTPNWIDIQAMQRNVVQTLVAGDTDWYGHLAAFEYPMIDHFQALTHPSLILTNTGDDLFELSRRAHELRPDLAYVELIGSNHDIVDEQTEAWVQAVVDFVRS